MAVAESGQAHEASDYSLQSLFGAPTLCQARCQGHGAGKARGHGLEGDKGESMEGFCHMQRECQAGSRVHELVGWGEL